MYDKRAEQLLVCPRDGKDHGEGVILNKVPTRYTSASRVKTPPSLEEPEGADLVLSLALHDHYLPGQVADDAGRRQGRVPHLTEVLHLKAEGGL